MILPELFENRMRELLGEEFEEYAACFEKKHYSGLRVNTLNISPEEFERISPFNIKRIPWIENGYFYDEKDQPAKHPYYYAGLYYIQEPSAMTPASLLPVSPGDKVLDLCAAPGGKSTELAARLKGEGLLVANDISNSRAKALLKNIELYGVKNAIVVSDPPPKLVNYFDGYFDKILVDAPCSGEGMFRKSPAIIKNWEQCGVDYYNKIQKEIILSAARMLKPGGKMLYSTCTFSPEENEGTIAFLLEQCPEFRVVNPLIDKTTVSYEGFSWGRPEWIHGTEELRNCIRLWPHRIQGEGHFITLLEKRLEGERVDTAQEHRDTVNLSEEAIEFLTSIELTADLKNISIREDKLYLLPKENPGTKGLRIMRTGLCLGDMKKNRFEPSQALASGLKMGDYNKVINLKENDTNTIKYLKGETIQVEGEHLDGWNLVCVDGHTLGWGKLSSGVLKNKFQPGWRWM